MANTSLALLLNQADALNIANPETRSGRELLRMVINHLEGIAAGNKRADRLSLWVDGTIPQRAGATIAISGPDSGTYTSTINGVGVDATGTGVAASTATAIAAAINASTDALVQYFVQASNWAGTVALASVAAGQTVTICGYPFTAKAGGVLQDGQFDQSGNDTADAASLVTQINKRAGLRDLVFASSSSGTVTLRQWSGTASAGVITGPSTFTITALAATATVFVNSLLPGIAGNAVTLAASGTGATASASRLSNGTGLNVARSSFNLPGGAA